MYSKFRLDYIFKRSNRYFNHLTTPLIFNKGKYMSATETAKQTSTIADQIRLRNSPLLYTNSVSSESSGHISRDINATVDSIWGAISSILNGSLHGKAIINEESPYIYGRKLRYQVQA